jgi:YHS domain-containing protein
MTISRIIRWGIAQPFLALMLFASAAMAGDTNLTFQGIAIQGYDPVAYFTEGKPMPGDANITATHDGAIYQFVSLEHKTAFEAAPARYAPQYGGYCAYAAAQGAKASIEPEQFTVFNDKLYLNYNTDVRVRWNQDRENYVSKADAYWASK